MEIGLGLDSRLGLTTAQLRDLAVDAKRLGYQSLWTNAGTDYDPIALCIAWNQRSGLPVGVSVVPVARSPAVVLALAARTAHELTDGHFVLGIGSGGIADRPVGAVRDYAAELRKVAPRIPLAIGALGPQMLRLASRKAQAAALNWCTPEHVTWSRERTGAATRLVEYIRVAIDDDVQLARASLARQILAYAVAPRPSGATGYRAHFERMGFGDELTELEARRDKGAAEEELVRAMPERLLNGVGYYGDGSDAPQRFSALAVGLDVAIVRVLNPRPGDARPVVRAMEVLAP